MFSTPETSVHVQDKNREISPLEREREREESYGGKDLEVQANSVSSPLHNTLYCWQPAIKNCDGDQ